MSDQKEESYRERATKLWGVDEDVSLKSMVKECVECDDYRVKDTCRWERCFFLPGKEVVDCKGAPKQKGD